MSTTKILTRINYKGIDLVRKVKPDGTAFIVFNYGSGSVCVPENEFEMIMDRFEAIRCMERLHESD